MEILSAAVEVAAGLVVVVMVMTVVVQLVVRIVALVEGADRVQRVLRPPLSQFSALTTLPGSSKWTSARQTGETGGAPPPPPPQIALAVDDDRPRGFRSHQGSFELFAWTTTVVGLAVFVSIAKWALDRPKVQRINRSVDICPVISASCPTVVQNPPDMCLRSDIASVYGSSSYPTPSYLPRQGLFHDRGCERVLDGVQFNISTEEAFEILNGAARPKIHQNGADIDCSNHTPSITTPVLPRPDVIVLFLFSLVVYLAGYVYRLPGRRHDTLIDQHPGGTFHVS